jgi:O-antigen/teichoic acid export membrane protein
MRTSLIIRAAATSWVAVIGNAIVGFLLTPFILHRLGDEEFGLWILIVTVTGYYGFLDAGVRSSILRYVSKNHAVDDKIGVKQVLATSFYYYLAGCLIVCFLTSLTVPWLPRFFSVRGNTVYSFQSLYLLAGLIQGITLPLNVFIGALEASGRFDQVYLSRVLGMAFRVIAVVIALRAGAGLFGLGAAVLVTNLLTYLIQIPLAIRAVDEFSLSPRWFDKATLRKMTGYGAITLTTGIGQQLRTYIYPVIIARFLTTTAVTLFSLPMKLLSFPLEGIATMTEIVNPVASRLEAKHDYVQLRRMIQLSVQTAFLIFIPMAAVLMVLGRELLSLWVGPQYVSAFSLLVLLTLGFGTSSTLSSVQSMLFGMEKHTGIMWLRLGEGVAITVFGIPMVRIWGLFGFALAISGVLLVTSLFLIPDHLCRVLGLRLRDYLVQGALKPLFVAVPMIAALLGLRSIHPIHSWASLLMILIGGGLVYALTLTAIAFVRPAVPRGWLSLGVLDFLTNRYLGNGKLRAFFSPETVGQGGAGTRT